MKYYKIFRFKKIENFQGKAPYYTKKYDKVLNEIKILNRYYIQYEDLDYKDFKHLFQKEHDIELHDEYENYTTLYIENNQKIYNTPYRGDPCLLWEDVKFTFFYNGYKYFVEQHCTEEDEKEIQREIENAFRAKEIEKIKEQEKQKSKRKQERITYIINFIKNDIKEKYNVDVEHKIVRNFIVSKARGKVAIRKFVHNTTVQTLSNIFFKQYYQNN